jgi:hypothetical protein
VAFAQLSARRAGLEGTFSQGVRAFGLRQARYRGFQQTPRQQVATATAIDVARRSDWLTGIPTAPTRRSHFARLAPASCIYQQYLMWTRPALAHACQRPTI